MAKFLYSLGKNAYAHKWRFLLAWALILGAVATAAVTLSKPTSDTFSIPGLESVETADKMREKFPEQGSIVEAPSGTIVLHSSDKMLTDPEVNDQVMAFVGALQAAPYLTDKESIVPPALAAQGLAQQVTQVKQQQGVPEEHIAADIAAITPLSPDQKTGQINIVFDAESSTKISADDIAAFKQLASDYSSGDLAISYQGNAFVENEVGGAAEAIGVAVAALVLMIAFGSLIAAGMPLISAIIGVAIGVLGITAATAFSDNINSMTPVLASMIGLAVGIDYALFIVSRFRKESVAHLEGEDFTPKELSQGFKQIDAQTRAHLAGIAVGKAGSAVVFAGLTVLIALAALTIIRIPFLSAMALGAAATVFIAVLVAVSLLPAVLGLFGTKVFSGIVPGVKVPDANGSSSTMGARWSAQIGKRPWLFLVAGTVILAVLAIPASHLRLAMPTDGSAPLGSPVRTAYDTTAEAFGPGRNAPIIALVEAPNTPEEAQPMVYGTVATALAQVDGVKNAQLTALGSSSAQMLITPTVGATDAQAREILEALRSEAETLASTQSDNPVFNDVQIGFTGVSPIFEDISDRLEEVLIPYIAIVLILAFILLMVVFRSLWVPLLAALGFALSIAATFGVTVLIFQEGALTIIKDPQPLISFLPIILIGIVFGLAMDYEVFIVSGMREGWTHGLDAKDSVTYGFTNAARVVTAAALIMISVFAAFILMDMQFIKTMGFALAAAVFFDAFIVRMTLIPATMYLLGKRAWSLPRWLDKILPKVDIEGDSLTTSSTGLTHGAHAVKATQKPEEVQA